MNTGLPRHFTVMAWPTWIGWTFTSIDDSASVSAAGLRLLMKGQAVGGDADSAQGAGCDHEEVAPGRIAMPAGRNC